MPFSLGFWAAAGAGAASAAGMELISTTILSTTASSVVFSSIPSTYKHLQVRMTLCNASSQVQAWMRFNTDTGTNYSSHHLYADGGGVYTTSATTTDRMWFGYIDASAYGSPAVVDILDYANATTYKTIRSFGGSINAASIALRSGNWRSTSAVSTLTILPSSGTLASGTRISLYGVAG